MAGMMNGVTGPLRLTQGGMPWQGLQQSDGRGDGGAGEGLPQPNEPQRHVSPPLWIAVVWRGMASRDR